MTEYINFKKEIILVRHAESVEDVDQNIHDVNDEKIGLTAKGKKQSIQLSKKLIPIVSEYDEIKVFHSPSRRVRDTAHMILSQFNNNNNIDISEVGCIRNLNWGDTTLKNVHKISKERYDAGVLYYQFPNGDHTPTFVSNIGKFVKEDILESRNKHFLIFTHGFALRVIVKFLLDMSDEEFKYLKNPNNCYHTVVGIDNRTKKIHPGLEKVNYKNI